MPLRDRLVADWRGSWRFLSVQVNAAVAALAAATFAAAPTLVVAVLRAPALERIVVAGMIAAAIIVPHWLARILKQKPKGACDGDQ